MKITYKDLSFTFDKPCDDFNELTEQIEKTLNYELFSLYQVYSIFDNEKTLIVNEEEYQQIVQKCKQSNTIITFIVQNANLSDANYILKKQISSDQSHIYQESVHSIYQKQDQLQQLQKLSSLSIWEIKDDDLSIPQILTYYQQQLLKFINNFEQQTKDHKLMYCDKYKQQYQAILKRMNEKLTQQMDLCINKQIQNNNSEKDQNYINEQQQQQFNQ